MMNYLIVDLNITLDGHKMGFIKETWLYLCSQNNPLNRYHFLINENKGIQTHNNLHIHQTPTDTQAEFDKVSGATRYSSQWNYINQQARNLSADRIILMEYDLYQLAIARDKSESIPISGILFRPYFRQKPTESGVLRKIVFNLKKQQKKLLLGWSVRNSSVKKVFVLNDQLTVSALNQTFRPVFSYLPDPVFDVSCTLLPDIRNKYAIPYGNKILLIFGYLDDRKNIPNILSALNQLPDSMKHKMSLLIIGKAAKSYKNTIDQAIEETSGGYQVIHKDEFVDDCEMEALFAQCDLVLRMNVNYFASSGIIGLAAKYNKPSLVSDYGIVADLTSQYHLGQLADPMDIEKISLKIRNFMEQAELWKIDGSSYYKDHKTSSFVESLLS